MAGYNSLSVAQKNNIALADLFYRKVLRALAQVENNVGAPIAEAFIQVNVDPVIATLDAGELIPNSTGLAGAQDLTVAQWTTVQTLLRSLNTEFVNNLALLQAAIGVNVND